MKDRQASLGFIKRAKDTGFEVLMLTVDTPVSGVRARDIRNGLTVPPKIGLKTFLDMTTKPNWWMNLLTTAPLEFAAFRGYKEPLAQLAAKIYDPTLNFEDISWLRTVWDGPIIIKGVQSVSDAEKLADIGVQGIVLSNHGGRQLDRAPVPFLLLPEVRKKIGKKAEIHVDTGIMHGADIVAALANGADFVWIGRAYLYGLMAGGREGVDRTIEILGTQILRTMKLLGVSSVSELKPSHVKTLNRFN